MPHFRKFILTIVAITVLIIGTTFTKATDFLADYIWFKEVGYTSTFITQIFAKLWVGIPFFVVFLIFIYLYFFEIKKSYYRHMNIVSEGKVEKMANLVILGVSVLLSLFFSFGISSSFWMEILKFSNSTSFGITDPLFNKDIGFYVFKLPLIKEIFSFLTGFLVFLMFSTAVFYIALMTFRPPITQDDFSEKIRNLRRGNSLDFIQKRVMALATNQILVIGIVFFCIVALRSYLATFELLYSPRGAAYGASYTDVHITLWAYRIQIVAGILSAVFLYLSYLKRKAKIALIGPIVLAVVMVLSTGVEALVQNLVVAPNELSKERKYIERSIKYTRMAYNLDETEEMDFPVSQNLTLEDMRNNPETIRNISINDYRPTREAYNQLQGIRGYYRFNGVDVDRYMIDGKQTQVFLSAREIDKERLSENAKTWLNRHLKYTHGYGITMSPVNEVTPDGQPKMIIRNVPLVSDYENLKVKRPQIYFGELTNDYAIVNTTEKEFDYPKGDTNSLTTYNGEAGIKLNLLNKALYSLKNNSFKLFVSSSINSDSKILINRNILDRAKKIAPFLIYDEDPYIVLTDEGKLEWIIDGYTVSSQYPYSEPYGKTGINYIRNSFKVTVDAYDGHVNYYVADNNDPIIKTYKKIFPKLFKSMEDMPSDLKSHIRYPKKMFSIQSDMYSTYHMENSDVFYNREDKWDIANENYGGKKQAIEPNYVTFKMPSEDKAEFLLNIPYTPKNKENMTGFMVARSDGQNYGHLKVFKFPKDKTILGPAQLEAKIDNDADISRDLSLWNNKGSEVIRGHLITVPIRDSVMYVEPLYIKSGSETSIPEVKRIVVAYKDSVVMAETFDKAIQKIFGGQIEEAEKDLNKNQDAGITQSNTLRQMIEEARDLYNKAEEALKAGDFSLYGQHIKNLGDVLDQIDTKSK